MTDVLFSPDDRDDIRIRGARGQWVRLVGRCPEADASRMAAARLGEPRPHRTVVLIGAGLGHDIEAIFDREPGARVVALEPDAEIAARLLSRRDWSAWTTGRQLVLLVGPDYAGASSAWSVVDANDQAPEIIVHPVVAAEWPERAEDARRIAERILFDARANADARARFAVPYLLQTLANLPVVALSGDAGRLFGRFQGVPAVVIGAGPSLDKNVAALKAARGRALLIAVDTALRPLLEQGVTPDFVTAVDPGAGNVRHLTDLPPAPNTWLVADPSVHPASFHHFADRTLLFRVAAHHPWPWLMGSGVEAALVRTWGSVLTSAFDLAVQMGCNPIVFAGADLAYTGGQPYCRGTIFEDDWVTYRMRAESLDQVWQSALAAKPRVEQPDVTGRPAATSNHLVAFRDWIVETAASLAGRRVVNGSGTGILHGPAIEQGDLHDVLRSVRPDPEFRSRLPEPMAEAERARRRLALADALAGARDDGALDAWAAAMPGDRRADLETVVASAIAGLTRPLAAVPAPPVRFRAGCLGLSEHAVRLRRLKAGAAADPRADGPGMRFDADESSECFEEARRELDALLAGRGPLLEPSSGMGDGLAAARVEPALTAFPWAPRVRPAVRSITSLLGQALRGVQPLPHGARLAWLRLELSPLFTEEEFATRRTSGTPAVNLEVIARRALELEYALVELALCGGQSDATRAAASLFIPSADAWEDVVTARTLSLDVPETTPDGMLNPTWRDMRALTGWLTLAARTDAAIASGASLRSVWTRPGLGRMDCRPCSTDLPRAVVVSGYDSKTAACTPWLGTVTLAMDASGSARPLAEWPHPIVGSVALEGGGLLAWSTSERIAMWRPAPASEVVVQHLPFEPTRAVVDAGGRVWWAGTRGGIWQGIPPDVRELRGDAPSWLWIEESQGDVVLHPFFRDDAGQPWRVSCRAAWRLPHGSGVAGSQSLGPLGQCGDVAVSPSWTARAYPYADLIRLTPADPSAPALDLACYFPRTLAWAGASLYVGSPDGPVLFWPHLVERLDRVRDGASGTGAAASHRGYSR